MRIGYLTGSDKDTAIAPDGMPIETVGNTDLFLLRSRDPGGYARLHVTPDYFAQSLRYPLDDFDLLLNLVTDPDQNPRLLATLAAMLEGFAGRVVNQPEAILRTTRDGVAHFCAGLAHVDAPSVLRIAGAAPPPELDGFPFPAILRLAGTHTGEILGLVEDSAAARALLVPERAHILTEFRDFRSRDGLYRKYRFFFIGAEIVMRHLLVSDRWNVHAADRARYMSPRPALVAEERDAIAYGVQALPYAARAGLGAIRAAVGLDLFGLDCALTEAGVLLFEANAVMNFFPLATDPLYAHLGTAQARARAAFDRLLFG
jgi:hypothetical protein